MGDFFEQTVKPRIEVWGWIVNEELDDDGKCRLVIMKDGKTLDWQGYARVDYWCEAYKLTTGGRISELYMMKEQLKSNHQANLDS